MTTHHERRALDVAGVASRAARDTGGVSAAFLDGYLELQRSDRKSVV